jgi:hypothetical protein
VQQESMCGLMGDAAVLPADRVLVVVDDRAVGASKDGDGGERGGLGVEEVDDGRRMRKTGQADDRISR